MLDKRRIPYSNPSAVHLYFCRIYRRFECVIFIRSARSQKHFSCCRCGFLRACVPGARAPLHISFNLNAMNASHIQTICIILSEPLHSIEECMQNGCHHFQMHHNIYSTYTKCSTKSCWRNCIVSCQHPTITIASTFIAVMPLIDTIIWICVEHDCMIYVDVVTL